MSETAHPPTNDRPKQDRFLANTAGELERESRSRRFNVIEAFLVMTILLITLWYVQYPFGILRGIEIVNTATTIFFCRRSPVLPLCQPLSAPGHPAFLGLGKSPGIVAHAEGICRS